MNAAEYMKTVEERMSPYYTIQHDLAIKGIEIDLLAEFHTATHRTIITKSDILDTYENNEYCLFKAVDHADKMMVDEFGHFLKNVLGEFVRPNDSHMNSYITGILVTEREPDPEVVRFVRAFKYMKAYRLFIHGWSEIRLILVDLYSGTIITNKAGSKVKKAYEGALNNNKTCGNKSRG
jgi:hypothetical protein